MCVCVCVGLIMCVSVLNSKRERHTISVCIEENEKEI